MAKTCKGLNGRGEPCRANPSGASDFCAFHDPEHAEAVQEGRRIGRSRRKRESTLAAAYDFEGLRTVAQVQRFIDVAAFDTLALDNTIARVRAIAYLAQTAIRLIEAGELEERLAAIESVLGPRVIPKTNGRNRR